jgi:hypothetical protein
MGDTRLIAGMLTAFGPDGRTERLRVADMLFACGAMRVLCRHGKVVGFCGVDRPLTRFTTTPETSEFQIVVFVADGVDEGAAAVVHGRLSDELLHGMGFHSVQEATDRTRSRCLGNRFSKQG